MANTIVDQYEDYEALFAQYEHLLPVPSGNGGKPIKTIILKEEIKPLEQTGESTSIPVFEMMGTALYTQSGKIDAAGQTHHCFGTGLAENNNITFVEYRKVPRHPGPYPQQLTQRIDPSQKMDTVLMLRSGRNLHFYLTTHALGAGSRRLRVELAIIENVFETNPQFEAEEDGPGAFLGGEMQPNPEPNPNPNPDPEYRLGADEYKDAFLGASNNQEFYNRFQTMVKNGVRLADLPRDLQPGLQSAVNAAVAAAVPNIVAQVVAGVHGLLIAGGPFDVFQQDINAGWSSNMVSLFDAGLWNGILPNGQRMNHPLTGRPLGSGPEEPEAQEATNDE